MRLEALAVDHVNAPIEQAGDVAFQADVLIDRYVDVGINVDKNIRDAVRPAVAACARAEQRGANDAACAKLGFVGPQAGDDVVLVQRANMMRTISSCKSGRRLR